MVVSDLGPVLLGQEGSGQLSHGQKCFSRNTVGLFRAGGGKLQLTGVWRLSRDPLSVGDLPYS